jgi:hypothetical protein
VMVQDKKVVSVIEGRFFSDKILKDFYAKGVDLGK